MVVPITMIISAPKSAGVSAPVWRRRSSALQGKHPIFSSVWYHHCAGRSGRVPVDCRMATIGNGWDNSGNGDGLLDVGGGTLAGVILGTGGGASGAGEIWIDE